MQTSKTYVGTVSTRRIISVCLSAPLASVALAALFLNATARGDQTWKNTGTDFNAGASWASGIAPGTGDEALFTGPEATQPNLSASLTILGLSFSNATAAGYDLTSSSPSFALTLTNIGTGTTSDALNGTNTSGTNTIDAALVLGAASGTQTFTQAAGGTMKINGTITGSSAITLSLTGSGNYDLAGNNSGTLAAPVTLGTGTTLQIGNDNALGTGTLAANGSTTTIQSDSSANRVLINALTIGSSTSTTLGTSTTGNLTFGAATLTGGTPRTVVVNNSITTFASLAQDSSARALTKQGSGALIVTGNTSYTSYTDVQAGTLAIGGSNATGSNQRLDGGVIAMNGTYTRALGTGTASVEWLLTSGGLAAFGTNASFGNSANNLSVNIGGSSAALTWGTTSSFLATGQTLILGSVVSDGTVTFANPLNAGGSSSTTNQTIEVDRGATATGAAIDATLSGGLTGTGGFIKTGLGTLSINPTNSEGYTGSLTINAGILAASGGTYFGGSNSTININGGTLRYDATYTGGGNAISVGASNSTIDVSGSNSYTTGAIGGSGSLTKTDTGTLLVNPSNTTYSGSLTINGGILAATAADYFGSTSSAININAGTLRYDATYTGASNTIALGSSTSTIDVSPTFSYTPGLVSGTGSLNKTDTGTLTLSSANTYSGGTNLTGGTIELGVSSVLSSGAISTGPVGKGTLTLGDSTTLRSTAATTGGDRTIFNSVSMGGNITLGDGTKTGILTFSPTGVTTAPTVALTANTALTINSAVAINDAISGVGFNLSKAGSGTLTLGAANTFSGATTISAGSLALGNTGALGSTTSITLSGSGVGYFSIVGLTGAVVNPAATLTLNGTSYFQAQGDPLTVASLSGVSGSQLTIGDYVITGTGGGTYPGPFTVGNATSTTYAGLITGAAASGTLLTKVGTGVLTLSGANTYTGPTAITAGTLLVANTTGSGTGTGPVNIGTAGTLASGAGATGIVSGLVTTAGTGSQIAPGATAASNIGTVGTLTLAGGLNLAAGATIPFDLGASSDRINLTGGTFTGDTAAGSIIFNFNNLGVTPGTYDLINFSGATSAVSISAAEFAATGIAGTFQITNGTEVDFITTVPEPGTILGGALVVGAFGWSRRRSILSGFADWRARF